MEENHQPEWGLRLSKIIPIPQRVILALMGFFAIVNAYTLRGCLSLALTQIVMPIIKNETEGKKTICPKLEDEIKDESKVDLSERYDWSQRLQGQIIGIFFLGYFITHLPGGWLSDLYGGKYVLSLGILSTSIFTIFTPMVIKEGGPKALMALRFFVGVGEGTTFPALATLVAQWVPLRERGILGSLVLGGGLIGNVVNTALSGWLLKEYPWPITFYVMSVLGILWFIFFTLMCFNDPLSHPYIKPREVEYLMQEMGRVSRNKGLKTPWVAIFTSCPMLSLVICQLGHDWGIFAMSNSLPKYMNDIIQLPIHKTGYYLSVTFLIMWFVTIFWGFLTDYIIAKEKMKLTTTRKVNTIIAAWGPGLFMVLASYAGCDRTMVLVMFCFSQGLMGPYFSGMKLTPLDMSPNFSGVLMAITNGIGSFMGFLCPVVVGWIVQEVTMQEWRIFFWISFGLLFITALQFWWFCAGEVQPWDSPKKSEE